VKLHQVRDVIAVAEAGSVRGAARRLGLAQSAVTRSIRGLERELGAALFERRNRGVTLTTAGSIFLRRAQLATNELRRAREEIHQHEGSVSGTVVACLSTVSHVALLPATLGPFRKRDPLVRLHIVEGAVYPRIESKLKDGTIDFFVGIVPNEGTAPDLVSEKLFDNTRSIVARIGHPLAKARSLAELVDAEWVSVGEKSEAELEQVFRQRRLAPPRYSAKGDSALSLVTLIAYTDLLAAVPRQWIDFPPIRTLLQRIDIAETIGAPPVTLIRRADMPLTPAAEHFCDLLRRASAQASGRATVRRVGKPGRS
jgi:DNA-binding transcriptional LysR family regulator